MWLGEDGNARGGTGSGHADHAPDVEVFDKAGASRGEVHGSRSNLYQHKAPTSKKYNDRADKFLLPK